MNALINKINDHGIKFGIELEMCGISKGQAVRAMAAMSGFSNTNYNIGSYAGSFATDDQGRQWLVVSDSSICPAGCEVVSPPLKYDDIELLQQVVRALRSAGAYTNTSCGQHVHISSPDLDAKGCVRLARLWHKWDTYMRQATGAGNNHYCHPLRADKVNSLEKAAKGRGDRKSAVANAWYDDEGYAYPNRGRYHNSRYNALNLNSWFYRGTVEFRIFRGTMHAGKVKGHVQAAMALVIKAIEAKSVKRDDTVSIDPDNDVAAYKWYYFVKGTLKLIGSEFKTARLHLGEAFYGTNDAPLGNRDKGFRKVQARNA